MKIKAIKFLLLGYYIAALLAFLSTRFYFWFPDWILKALVGRYYVESPRGLSFFIFQIPGYFVDILLPFSTMVFEIKKTLLNAILSFYPVIGATICVYLLSRQQRKELLIYPLIAFGLLYPYASLPTFSGSQHAFFFFWILMCFPNSNADTKTKISTEIMYGLLYVLFYFCYPPFSFIGSIVLLLRGLFGNRQTFRVAVAGIGTAAAGIHLLFLQRLFSNQTYTETFLAFEVTRTSFHFYFLILISIGLILGFTKHKLLLLICILAALAMWIFGEVYRPAELLANQFHNRIFVYAGSAFIGICMLWVERRKMKCTQLSWLLTLVVLATGLFSDIRGSFEFWNQKQFLKSQISDQKNCSYTNHNTYYQTGISPWEFPFHTLFNWNDFNGRFVLCDPSLPQKAYPHCTFRILDAIIIDECGKEQTDLDSLLKNLRAKVMNE